jgi:hypothetical protein
LLGIASDDSPNTASDPLITTAVIAAGVRGKRIGEETAIPREAICPGVTYL